MATDNMYVSPQQLKDCIGNLMKKTAHVKMSTDADKAYADGFLAACMATLQIIPRIEMRHSKPETLSHTPGGR